MIYPKYLGGKKRDNGLFSIIENGRMIMGSRHIPMTKNERMRFLNAYKNPQKKYYLTSK